jgi:hypothetical protein
MIAPDSLVGSVCVRFLADYVDTLIVEPVRWNVSRRDGRRRFMKPAFPRRPGSLRKRYGAGKSVTMLHFLTNTLR